VGTADGYVQARLDLRAVREDIFTSKIEDEIRRKQIRIEAQPADPRPHQAVELSAVFASDDCNRPGARDEFECWWTMGKGSFVLTAPGPRRRVSDKPERSSSRRAPGSRRVGLVSGDAP